MKDLEMATPPKDSPADNGSSKNSDKKLFIGLGTLFLFMAIAYGLSLGPLNPDQENVVVEGDQAAEIEQAFSETESVGETTPETSFDLSQTRQERVLGDRSAPIKITEHSSLTCGRCGQFHTHTFKKFKSAYIDTGKAYLVFSDFPLNAPALHATMVARCISEERYFDFTQQLFEKQEEWAREADYLSYLEEKAAGFGLGESEFKSCVQNEELQEVILKRMQAVQAQWEVRSTPSFVINNQKVITGALSFEAFDKAIQDAVTAIEEEQASPKGPDAPSFTPSEERVNEGQ